MDSYECSFTAVLCDDELSIVQYLSNEVKWEKLGIKVIGTAGNGSDALNLIIENNPDIAIMDIKMPGMLGLETLRRAKDANCSTFFIILSGYDDFQYAKEAIQLGAKAYLLKPLNISELHDTLFCICAERSNEKNTGASQSYRKQLDLNFFKNLLDGNIPEPATIRTLIKNSALKINDTECYVCVISYQNCNNPDTIPYGKIIDVLNHDSKNINHVFIQHNSQIVCIFNTVDNLIMQQTEHLLNVIHDNNFPDPVIGIGDTVSGLIHCPYSYSRAITALTYRLYNENIRIFTFDMICTVPPSLQLSDIDYLPLVQFIVRKDLQGIRNYCDDFFTQLLYVKMPPPNYVYSTCYAIFHMIEEEIANYSNGQISELSSPENLFKCKNISVIKKWLVDSFYHLSEFIDAVYGYASAKYDNTSNRANDSDEIIQTAKSYIHGNITNHVKIEDIAKEVHLSTSYFAIYFKNKTNVNLRDYILTEKMEYARKALINPNTSITEIAYSLGYQDYRSFSRAFKNVHNITPSDFQAKYRH